MSWMTFFDPKEDTLKVSCWYLHLKCVSKGGEEGGYLEDIEGSWPETWRTGSSMTLWMYLVDPEDHIMKVLCHYLYVWRRYKDVTKLSGYDPWGLTSTSMPSWMTLSSGQEPSMSSKYPASWPPSPATLLIEISTWNVQGIFLRVKRDHLWH